MADYIHSQLAQEGVLLLRIAKSSLPGRQNEPLVADHICVLRSKIQEISPLTGDTAKWLMKISKLIFDPLGQGELFTLSMQHMDDSEVSEPLWVKVQETDQIQPQINEYPSEAPLTLAKISFRTDDSRTSKPHREESAHLHTELLERDQVCAISGIDDEAVLAVSRLIPKRMSDSGTLAVGKRASDDSTRPSRLC
jgi:hypothetical protein